MKLSELLFKPAPGKKLVRELNALYAFAELHPDDIRVHLRIADVLMKMGQRAKAIEQYLHAAELYEANGLSQIAAAIYKQVISIDPEQIDTYHALSDLYRREGIIGDAVATCERLARHYCDRGLRDKVTETLELMFAMDPQSIYVKKKIAQFYAEKRIAPESVDDPSHGMDWELSDTVTGNVHAAPPHTEQSADTFFDLGAALESDWETDGPALDTGMEIGGAGGSEARDAIAGFEDIFREIRQEGSAASGQDDSLYHYNLGTAYHTIGRYDDAVEELIRAMENPQRSIDCHLLLAACARERGLFKEALRYVKKGLKHKGLSDAKKIALQYEMAVTYKMKGKMRKAHKLFRSIYNADSEFREVKRELAEVS
jgi:tetratricopeptide (TPR) repeat protein